MHYLQQNKCYPPPPKVLTCPFRSNTILAVANLLAHNNISEICYCGQISLQSAAVNYSFSDNLIHIGVPYILLAIVHSKLFYSRMSFLFSDALGTALQFTVVSP